MNMSGVSVRVPAGKPEAFRSVAAAEPQKLRRIAAEKLASSLLISL
jgi:hypothetical protein